MLALGSLLLYCAWATGVIAAFLTIRSFEEWANTAEPRRRIPIALACAIVGSLWLPWVTSANGQITLSGWFALDAATVVSVVLLAAGVGALAALPDRGGEHRELLSLALALSLFGIIAGNWLIGAGGGWGNHLRWGAAASLATSAALAAVEAAHHQGWGTRSEPEEGIDQTAELHRLDDLRHS